MSTPTMGGKGRTQEAIDDIEARVATVSELYALLNDLDAVSRVQLEEYCDRGVGSLRETNNSTNVCLDVSDDGVGLPPGFDLEACGGLGTKLIDGMVKQLSGTLEFTEHQGTRAVISAPVD